MQVSTFIAVDDDIRITLNYNPAETSGYDRIIAVGANNIHNGTRYYSGTEIFNLSTTSFTVRHTVDDMPFVNPTICTGTLIFYGIKSSINN